MAKLLRPAFTILLFFAILTGIIYPLAVTGLAQSLFPAKANGSLILRNGSVVGSTLIGQQFTDAKYFWGRPSATKIEPYNASASGGSNYSVLNPDLQLEIQNRITALKKVDPTNTSLIPIDLVTSSASGLDPHISVAAANYQAGRVALARGIGIEKVKQLIQQFTHKCFLDLCIRTVNVIGLNLALDALK